MNNLHIKKGDTVVVLSGDDAGVKGEVIATSTKEGKVIVKGVHIIHKHVKPRREGETGGIVDAEGAIYASKVALYCPDCKKGVRTHVVMNGDKKIRVCSGSKDGKPCGHKFD